MPGVRSFLFRIGKVLDGAQSVGWKFMAENKSNTIFIKRCENCNQRIEARFNGILRIKFDSEVTCQVCKKVQKWRFKI